MSSDRGALRDANVKAALLDLLERENTLIESTLRESHEQTGISGKYGEGYGEYYSKLLATVSSTANWKDPNQLCILTHGSYDPESAFASRLAAAGSAAVPCLVKMSGSDLGLTRAKAVAVLVRISAKSRLDSATSQSIRQIVLRALRDSSDTVRSDAVHALGKFGGEDMIEALREVEQSDPSPEVQGLSIRADATKAIAAIHRRTGGN